jgi:hypothetical protein
MRREAAQLLVRDTTNPHDPKSPVNNTSAHNRSTQKGRVPAGSVESINWTQTRHRPSWKPRRRQCSNQVIVKHSAETLKSSRAISTRHDEPPTKRAKMGSLLMGRWRTAVPDSIGQTIARTEGGEYPRGLAPSPGVSVSKRACEAHAYLSIHTLTQAHTPARIYRYCIHMHTKCSLTHDT